MVNLIFQLFAFATVSLLFGMLFKRYDLNFFLGVAFGITIQFIASYVFNSIINAFVALKNKKLENERIKEFTMQGLEVECPCSKKVKAFVPVRLNTANKYKCAECLKTVSVIIDSTTALTTEPLDSTDTLDPNIFKNAIT